MTCSPAALSYQALLMMPWWPGCAPVRMPVWLARVTRRQRRHGPVPNECPSPMSRATLGASPAAAISCSTLALQPSNRKPMTWRGDGAGRRRARRARRRPAAAAGRRAAAARSGRRPSTGAPPMSASTVGRDVDELAGTRDDPERPHPGPGQDERRPRLHHGRVEPCSPRWPPWSSQLCGEVCIADQVGRPRRVEDLRHHLVGERVRHAGAVGPAVRALVGGGAEAVDRLVGQGVATLDRGHVVAPRRAVGGAGVAHRPVEGAGLVDRVAAGAVDAQHHLHDGLERGVEQGSGQRLDLGRVGVGGGGRQR